MKFFLTLFLMSLGACASGSPQNTPAGAAPNHILSYLGEYYAPHDTLYVREMDGRLEMLLKREPVALTKLAGDTFALPGGRRLVLTQTGAQLDTQSFVRRTIASGTFKITPLKPVAELRALALNAKPPAQPDSLLKPDFVELKSLDPTIKYDIRYATTNNFMGDVFYSSAHAFMQRPAAEAVARAHNKLKSMGFGLLIHDAYRPWYVTKMFWEATPDSLKDFVADPASGSRHNRGAAVDLTLYDLKTGNPVEMTGGYDEFSERSFPTYPGGTTIQRWRRDLLKSVMEAEGFRVYNVEWWHFDYKDWRRYPVSNLTFEQLLH